MVPWPGFIMFISTCLWLLSFSLSYATDSDVNCLRTIKSQLQDPNGYLSSWNFENMTEGFICEFSGIDCWHGDESRVLQIKLSGMGLKGEFPRGVKNCTTLVSLDLSKNQLSGPIPSDISQIVRYITLLDLSFNKFSGEIPVSLSNCSYLNTLKLDSNRLSGKVPPELALLDRVTAFSVANNLLRGPIPDFKSARIAAESYANNRGLCGEPLPPCQPSASLTTKIVAIAAVAGLTGAAIGTGIGLFIYSRKGEHKGQRP